MSAPGPAGLPSMTSTPSPVIGSLLIGSTDAERLRAWYEQVFAVRADVDGFLPLGVGLLVDARDDVAPRSREPGRVVLNVHVSDARAAAQRLEESGAPWVSPLEYRDAGAWFGTVTDPDGNLVQVIELTPEYWRLRGERQRAAGSAPALLAAATPAPRLPAQDLDRARRFYAEKLGLEPVEERPGGLRYRCGGAPFSLFLSSGRPSGEHTQMGWQVDDLDAVVAELRRRGVRFEDVDIPGLRTVDGIAEVEGNYPSDGGFGERAAWFRDSEGNLLGLGQALARPAPVRPASPSR
jgi:catechol 2,3-dioxygenase-like lactoylglutathione lyase family enzyme